MLENLRRKSLVKTYIDPTYQVHFEQGHVAYLDSFSIEQYRQRLSKENQEKNFSSTFDGVSKGFRLTSYTLRDVKFNMIVCPSGKFTMGHIDQKDNPPREETIERPFLLGETEVTQELDQGMYHTPTAPIGYMSWYNAISFCNELSELQGLEKCYILTNISKKDRDGYDRHEIMYAKVTCDFNKNGYRLPTEKEWEYAAKAGTQNQWAGTNDPKELDGYAWFNKFFDEGTKHAVKRKLPNEWGFYDMSGNVSEWCWDMFFPNNTNPDAQGRVMRGGNDESNSSGIRIDMRIFKDPISESSYHGLRLCRSIV